MEGRTEEIRNEVGRKEKRKGKTEGREEGRKGRKEGYFGIFTEVTNKGLKKRKARCEADGEV